MTVSELAQLDDFEAVALPEADREIDGAYSGDLLSWVMGRARAGNAWITIMSNINVVAVASLADTACVILAEGVIPDEEFTATAQARQVNVLRSGKPAYEISLILGSVL
ncbi:MAG: hypothetical protein K6F64_06180 [Clostridia bacterium]|nr:hypothetical protein [Clostridia bacterium]